MTTDNSNEKRVALLIDGDNNVSTENLPRIVEIAKARGELIDGRVCGDGSKLRSLENVMVKYALQPCFSLKPISTKNTADIRLIIEAMDILHDGMVDVICVASSDSDFRELGIRIKKSGIKAVAICVNAGTEEHFGDAFEIVTLGADSESDGQSVFQRVKEELDDRFDENKAKNKPLYLAGMISQLKLKVNGFDGLRRQYSDDKAMFAEFGYTLRAVNKQVLIEKAAACEDSVPSNEKADGGNSESAEITAEAVRRVVDNTYDTFSADGRKVHACIVFAKIHEAFPTLAVKAQFKMKPLELLASFGYTLEGSCGAEYLSRNADGAVNETDAADAVEASDDGASTVGETSAANDAEDSASEEAIDEQAVRREILEIYRETRRNGKRLLVGYIGNRLKDIFGVKKIHKRLNYDDSPEMLRAFGYTVERDESNGNIQWVSGLVGEVEVNEAEVNEAEVTEIEINEIGAENEPDAEVVVVDDTYNAEHGEVFAEELIGILPRVEAESEATTDTAKRRARKAPREKRNARAAKVKSAVVEQEQLSFDCASLRSVRGTRAQTDEVLTVGGEDDGNVIQLSFEDQLSIDTLESAPAESFIEARETPLSEAEQEIKDIITEILALGAAEDGWMLIGEVSAKLRKRARGFKVKDFGFIKMEGFTAKLGFEQMVKPSPKSLRENGNAVFIRASRK